MNPDNYKKTYLPFLLMGMKNEGFLLLGMCFKKAR